ncbi:unnamed protein product [Mytilus edulis]|uniref:Uncharacterized protein n=1 Tax=Mytilus edulis TaxID=6550 RepID=A0A8S3RPK2_MYTED|nr:unnamed protein product [Mytilus edulis]
MSTKGVIGKKSIEDIWKKKKYKKFQDHKEYLLGVMTYLDILVEPKRYDKSQSRVPSDFYYVASMVRTSDATDYRRLSTFGHRNIGLAFCPPSSMIPPALSFRFISYCLGIFAVKTYGQNNDEMLFHRSAVFNIDPHLDMLVNCDDEIIIVRLVHAENRTLIIRDLASSLIECLAVALEKISQLYVRTSSTGAHTSAGSFKQAFCCSSSDDPCLLKMTQFQELDNSWICPKHRIEHTKDMLSSWIVQKKDIQCGLACPERQRILKQSPTDLLPRRLPFSSTASTKQRIGNSSWNAIMNQKNGIWNQQKNTSIDWLRLWKQLLALLVELGMDFHTWEDIRYRQMNGDLARLNLDILQEWKTTFCTKYNIRPSLRHIGDFSKHW